jgi:hypothetical protein
MKKLTWKAVEIEPEKHHPILLPQPLKNANYDLTRNVFTQLNI